MKIGMLFPGYGSQYVGMGKELYDASRIIQEYFEEASNCLNENFVKLCFASSDAELAKMHNAYPALFLTSSSIFALLKEKGIKPDVVAGYTIGEYAALYAAGSITFPDGLYLLHKLALFYQEALNNMEVACAHVRNISRNSIQQECLAVSQQVGPLTVAIYNNETDHIVSGTKTALEALKDRMGNDINIIAPEMGLHSNVMDNVVEQLVIHLTKVDFHDLNVPLINCIHAEQVTAGEEIKEGIVAQINHSVIWDQVLTKLADCDLIIEIGPGTFLSNLVKEQYPDKKIISVQKQTDIDEIIKIVGPVDSTDEDSE